MVTNKARDRMEDALATRLEQMGLTVRNLCIYPATGYWRQTRADVMQFTGSAIIDGVQQSIGCWESVSDCLRYGFTVTDERGNRYADAPIMVEAKGRRYVR